MRSHSLTVPAFALAASVFLALGACSDGSSSEVVDGSSTAASESHDGNGSVASQPASDNIVTVIETAVEEAPEPEPVVEEPEQVPVLGYINMTYVEGFGTVQPDRVTNGGMCTSTTISSITWDNWGGETATGTGTKCVSAGAIARGEDYHHPEPMVAGDLGDCGGIYAYRSLQIGDLGPINICTP